MTTITLDRETAARLRAADGPVTFLDPDGGPVPGPPAGTPPVVKAPDDPDDGFWSEEDVEEALRRVREPGPRRTFAEVWERIYAEHGRPEDVPKASAS